MNSTWQAIKSFGPVHSSMLKKKQTILYNYKGT